MRAQSLAVNVGLVLALATLASGADPASIGPPFTVPIDSDGVQRTTVILDSYSYEPAHLIVQKGKPVELTLKSATILTPHNFIIKDPAGTLSVEQDVSAGKTTVVKFTPMQSGTFPIYCDKRLWPLPSHRDKGMEGKLEVR